MRAGRPKRRVAHRCLNPRTGSRWRLQHETDLDRRIRVGCRISGEPCLESTEWEANRREFDERQRRPARYKSKRAATKHTRLHSTESCSPARTDPLKICRNDVASHGTNTYPSLDALTYRTVDFHDL